jgi:hypothetical protein
MMSWRNEMPLQNILASTLTSGVGLAALRRIKLIWIFYGAIAYVGLRLMRRYGIYADQADRALGFIDSGISQLIRSQGKQRASTLH